MAIGVYVPIGIYVYMYWMTGFGLITPGEEAKVEERVGQQLLLLLLLFVALLMTLLTTLYLV